jgi:hypothetical protein
MPGTMNLTLNTLIYYGSRKAIWTVSFYAEKVVFESEKLPFFLPIKESPLSSTLSVSSDLVLLSKAKVALLFLLLLVGNGTESSRSEDSS